MIEIQESDEIYKEIEFLDFDLNYIQKGYIIYKDVDIFSLEYIFREDAYCSSGKNSKCG